MSVDQSLRHELEAEQRRANLRPGGIPTPESLDRRRHQIATVGIVVALGILLAMLLSAGVVRIGSEHWIDSDLARLATIGFGVAMVLYAFDQERHLRRVERSRDEIVALESDIASNLLGAGLVFDAVCAVHSSVELTTVLETITEQGCALVGAERGVLFASDDDGSLDAVHDPAEIAALGAPIADLVGARGTVVAVTETTGTDIGVPLRHHGVVLGALVLPGVLAERLTPDLEAVLLRFGDAAGVALANARRYEAAMFLMDVVG